MIYPQEIAAMEAILAQFKTRNYVMLLAPMQSGKTSTYKLTACEMLRLGLVDRVVIFSGNRETALRSQTKDNESFLSSYRQFLRNEKSIPVEESEEKSRCKLEVYWGQDLRKFKPSPRTFYIWEESHYGQSQKQQVDLFLQKCGIQATGDAPEGSYLLSVSATPFSELSDNHYLDQAKPIVRLIPGESYLSIKKMNENGQIVNVRKDKFNHKFNSLLRRLAGYALVRASTKKQPELIQMVKAADCEYVEYDMDHPEMTLSILENAPTKPTVIFIKGKCRMGHRITKTHIDFCVETSSKNTDTILQSLLGRCCGYDGCTTIKVYIESLKQEEIDTFISLYEGDLAVPSHAANIIQGHRDKQRQPIIPMRLKLEKEPENGQIAQAILENLEDLENDNPPEDNEQIIEIVRKICQARAMNPKERSESDLELVKHWKLHVSSRTSKIYETGIISIRDAFRNKVATADFGSGGCGGVDEVVIYKGYKKRGDELITVIYIGMKIIKDIKTPIPLTTGKEVFARATEVEEDEEASYTMTLKPEVRTNAKLLERSIYECIRQSGSQTLNAPACIKNITVSEEVFEELEAIKGRFNELGIKLVIKQKRGRKPKGNINLDSISWTKHKQVPEKTIAEHVLDQ